ncbi:uncharacterized protein PFLUO_LOCUS2981 [Penicillium psychrofluorescens]|uniref:uncharacterized protein n=1 Tax=Penicillium psychrofluorescens TaxID=3158075 RepID=UPI003CCE1F02
MDYTTLPFPQDPNRHLPSVHEQGIAIFIDCHPGYWLEADNGLRFQLDPSPITNDFPLYPVHGAHRFSDPSHNAYYRSGFRPGGPPIVADAYLSSHPVAYAVFHPVHAQDVIYQEHRRREPKVDLEVPLRASTPLLLNLLNANIPGQKRFITAQRLTATALHRRGHHDNQQQQQQNRTQRQQARPLLPQPEWHPPSQTTNPEIVAVQFADVAAHTAKCDKCDRRNKNGMTRCLSCGWQCCRPCLDARGGDRSHRYLGTLHSSASELPDSVVVQQRETPTPTRTTTTAGARAADDNLGSEPSDLTRTSDLSSLGVTTPSGSGSGSRDVSSPSGGADVSGTSGDLPEPMDLDFEEPEESMDSEETLSWTSHSGDEGKQRAKSGRVRRNPGRQARFSSSMTTDSN